MNYASKTLKKNYISNGIGQFKVFKTPIFPTSTQLIFLTVDLCQTLIYLHII